MPLTDYFDAFCRDYRAYKGGPWCYEDGCIYRGLDLLYDVTADPRWRAHLRRLVDAQVGPEGELAGYNADEFNIDNILAGRVLFSLWRETGEARYLAAARRLADQLDRHPRISLGNYWHKLRYPHQVWLDGLYMGLPFQIEYGLVTGETERIKDALTQFQTALDVTATASGLYVHGYDESRAQSWSDPETGKSPAVWARAMGWLAMALVDALALLREDGATAALRQRTRRMLLAVADLQGSSGLWPQVLDNPGLAGNYEESSASAMFAYAFLRAARLGLISGSEGERLRDSGLKALDALQARVVMEGGQSHFQGICHVAGLGGFDGIYRDGTPEYYLTEPVVQDDAKGVGPLMMAWAESERVTSLAAE
ncbi:glycoside hydrolase family 88/105 protein [Paracoccus ravus]|uniref:glycoside hydrolase family 88/105 protein n=1 Tax=Paracoccus ravus TaxID=2447760 RepID=UPI00106EC071|nr:glycoside hydrolase family 88 protein [Paracoccus ravus]